MRGIPVVLVGLGRLQQDVALEFAFSFFLFYSNNDGSPATHLV